MQHISPILKIQYFIFDMPVNFNNMDSYEALEEILKWKRKRKPKRKAKDKIEVEISIRNLFSSLNKS